MQCATKLNEFVWQRDSDSLPTSNDLLSNNERAKDNHWCKYINENGWSGSVQLIFEMSLSRFNFRNVLCLHPISSLPFFFSFYKFERLFAVQIKCNEIMKKMCDSFDWPRQTGGAILFIPIDSHKHSMADHFVLCNFAAHILVSLSHTYARAAKTIIEKNAQYYHDDITELNCVWVDVKHRHTAFWGSMQISSFRSACQIVFYFVKNTKSSKSGIKIKKNKSWDRKTFAFPLTAFRILRK